VNKYQTKQKTIRQAYIWTSYLKIIGTFEKKSVFNIVGTI
jgi:hypothetical protein